MSVQQVIRKISSFWVIFFLLIIATSQDSFATEEKDYQVGEHLKKSEPSAAQSHEIYIKMDWDTLMPEDWDPMKPIKGLDFSKLSDSDPRAIKALAAIGDAWKNAPVDPKLNGKKIEIAGFVVPLDMERDNIKEFLLVPYFGACIHVPPPPSNQVIHIINNLSLSKDRLKDLHNALFLQGPIVVSGTLETVSSNTSMGFASYEMKADIIIKYQQPQN